LASLVDNSVAGSPKLPSGYENFFNNVQSNGYYWSSTTNTTGAVTPERAWGVFLYSGSVSDFGKSFDDFYVWCVRGGHGHDGY
jgi:hypothetical protein